MAWQGPLREVAPGVHEIDAAYRGRDGTLRMRVPGRIVAEGRLLGSIADDLAPEQVANVASLPGIVGHSLAMPDIHWGYGFPIGGVAAFDPDEGGVVSPGGVGFDINCGVRLLATDLDVEEVRPRLAGLIDALYEAVPCGMGKKGSIRPGPRALADILHEGAGWADAEGLLLRDDRAHIEEGGQIEGATSELGERALTRGVRSLGSLGSGNHFLEVQHVDQVLDEAAAKAYGLGMGQVVVMIHTGSRGLGHQVCQEHVGALQDAPRRHGIELVDRQLACTPIGSKEADAYLGAMAAAANFAFVNRSIIADLARRTFASYFGGGAGDMPVVYDVAHNIAKWEEHVVPGTTTRRRLLLHRKGATRAFAAGHAALSPRDVDVGQPVIVPGDMGRASYVLAASPGALASTFGSCCHGAGRRLSRGAAKRQVRGADLIARLRAQGIFVRAATPDVAAEEAPEAYKDVTDVVDSVQVAGLARKVARLRPLGVVKG